MTSVTPVMKAAASEQRNSAAARLRRSAPCAERALLPIIVRDAGVVRRATPSVLDGSGREAVDPDLVGAPFDRKGARERVDARLCRRRVRLTDRAERCCSVALMLRIAPPCF